MSTLSRLTRSMGFVLTLGLLVVVMMALLQFAQARPLATQVDSIGSLVVDTVTPPSYPGPSTPVPTSPLPTGYPAPGTPAPTGTLPPQDEFVGPVCYIDPQQRIALSLPSGWYGSAPRDTGGVGAASFFNFDRAAVQYDHGFPLNLPENHIKIELTHVTLLEGQSFDTWVQAAYTSATFNTVNPIPVTVTQLEPYQLGAYQGYAFGATDAGGLNTQTIYLNLGAGKAIAIGLDPANSSAMQDALQILVTLDASGGATCIAVAPVSSPIALPPIPHNELASVQSDVAVMPLAQGSFACPTGTFPGTEAPQSTITLQMPFLIGQRWVVGGGGSFYGNHHHCNYYNQYYATDWNYPASAGEDRGQPVFPIASGTVTGIATPPCPSTTRYGCYVQVNHGTNSYRSLYAHLDTVSVALNASVTTHTLIGTVGISGNSGGNAHLHLNFERWGIGEDSIVGYYSRCDTGAPLNCPNSESRQRPQGNKPAPIQSTIGAAIILDGGTYTSINGSQVYLPLVRK